MRTIGKLRRVGLIGLATLLAGVLTSAGAAPAVAEEPTYDIVGIVDFDGIPQSGVQVCDLLTSICDDTDTAGNYALSGLGKTAKVYAKPGAADTGWIETWYPEFPRSDLSWLDLTSPERPDSIDIHLIQVTTISGVVVSTTGARISHALVCVAYSDNCTTASARGGYALQAQIPRDDDLILAASAPGYHSGQKATRATTKVKIVLTKVKPPRITSAKPKLLGTKKVGKKLRVKVGSWGPGSVHFSYRWYRNGHRISGATKRTYRLTWADWRKNITVKVVATKPGYRKAVRSSKSTGWIRWSTWRHR